jgi:hypothetical protein
VQMAVAVVVLPGYRSALKRPARRHPVRSSSPRDEMRSHGRAHAAHA